MAIKWTPAEEIVRFDENGDGVITGQLVRCGRCKWWSEPVDEVDGILYGQCERPITAINHHSLVSSTWYCGDGELEVQDGQ